MGAEALKQTKEEKEELAADAEIEAQGRTQGLRESPAAAGRLRHHPGVDRRRTTPRPGRFN